MQSKHSMNTSNCCCYCCYSRALHARQTLAIISPSHRWDPANLHWFSKCLLSVCFMPGTLPGVRRDLPEGPNLLEGTIFSVQPWSKKQAEKDVGNSESKSIRNIRKAKLRNRIEPRWGEGEVSTENMRLSVSGRSGSRCGCNIFLQPSPRGVCL